jgi:regulator of cell morphogenesis and NO signaling
MSINITNTVRQVALEVPGAVEIFDRAGIDYCCGGSRSIGEACARAGVRVDYVIPLLEEIEKAGAEKGVETRDWRTRPLGELTRFVVDEHHSFTRRELDRLRLLLAKVTIAHAENHPELLAVKSLFDALERDLLPHMLKEEQVLFPYIERLEGVRNSYQAMPVPFFGTVRNPIRMMMTEHDRAGELLQSMRAAALYYAVPGDACPSYKLLCQGLEAFERDLHRHIHLENNILFPGAIELEG